ncbi:glycosyltransferase family 4 protein [Alcaligenaceae bacterium]|nr:glycosyltransferase family 4 protein [Alcaligenaceae bacterium]
MKILIIGGYAPSLISFRGSLIKALIHTGHSVIACAAGEDPEVKCSLSKLGCRYISIPMSRAGLNPIADIRYMSQLRSLMMEFRPDTVLTYSIKPLIWGSLAARLCNIPNICPLVTGLGYAFGGKTLKQRILKKLIIRLYKTAFNSSSTVAFQNPDNQKLFHDLKIVPTSRSVVVNGSGVDMKHYGFHRPLPAAPTFLLIARILHDKGIFEYARAAAIVQRKYKNIRFLLVGPQDVNPMALTQAELEKCIAIGGLEYLGELKDVRPAILESSVYVLPSYGEGTPRSVLEAMAMGRAVITTDAPGCRETVISGKNGFLVPVGDHASLANIMEEFIVNTNLAEDMGRESYEYAKEKFDVNIVNKQIFKFLGLSEISSTHRPSLIKVIP